MNAKEAIRIALTSTRDMVPMYLGDLSDADLLVRPVAGANHIAWQLGHLIASESRMGQQLPGSRYPELPAGFAEQHGKEKAAQDPPRGFGTKASYLDLFTKVRGATLAALEQLSETDLDRPTEGPMAQYAPTLAALLVLNANHVMMHAGQFTVVRRKLGKPILF
jgi:hypothetical protein